MTPDQQGESALFALNALPEDERSTFEQHLQTCSACRVEVAEFATTVARIGATASTSPPPGLRGSVLGQLASTPQLEPMTSGPPSRAGFGSYAGAWLLAAAVLLLVVAGGVVASSRGSSSQPSDPDQQLTALLAAPDSVTVHNQLGPRAALTVVASRRLDRAVMVVNALPELEAGHTYQMWLIDEQGPRSAGLVGSPLPDQPTTVVVDAIQGVREVAITVEPTGGSKAPTTRPIAGARLA